MLGKLLEEFDPRELCGELRRTGCSVISLQLYEAYLGKINYMSKLYPELCLYGNRDLTREYIRAARENDLSVWFYADERGFPRGSILYDRYRDCIEVDRAGRQSISWHPSVACCINSRWREFVKEIYQEALGTYTDVEGIIVSDEAGYLEPSEGYDSHCQEKFQAKYGAPLPITPEWDNSDSLWWKHIRERMHWWTDYIDFLCKICKETNPKVQTGVLIRHYGIADGPLFGVDWWEVVSLDSLDWIGSSAFFRTDYHDHPLYVQHGANLVAALAQRKQKKSFMVVSSHRNISPQDAKLALYNTALGGPDMVHYFTLESVHNSPAHQRVLTRTSRTVNTLPMCLPGAQSPKKAALLFSRDDWMGYPEKQAAAFFSESLGLFEALRLSHVPTEMVFDEDLRRDSLRAYQMLVMPRRGSLSETDIPILKDFVKDGGKLVLILIDPETRWAPAMHEFCDEVMRFKVVGRTSPVRYLSVAKAHGITAGIDRKARMRFPMLRGFSKT